VCGGNPDPLGTHYTPTVHGETWTVVRCEGCGKPYAYHMEVRASASNFNPPLLNEEGARQEAAFYATERLCLEGGSYQHDMIARVRGRKLHPIQVVGALVFACGPVLLLDEPGALAFAVGVALLGLGLVAGGMLLRRRLDPNACDPEPRKQLGRSQEVGERSWSGL
jgi:hypothetical protein